VASFAFCRTLIDELNEELVLNELDHSVVPAVNVWLRKQGLSGLTSQLMDWKHRRFNPEDVNS
jgi:hypothetical protein